MAAIDITPRHHFVQPRQSRRRHAYPFGLHLFVPPELTPPSPDEMAFGQLRASNLIVISNSYAGSSSRILTDPTGERRNRQFRQCFRGLRSCRPNPSGESGLKQPQALEFRASGMSDAEIVDAMHEIAQAGFLKIVQKN